MCYFLHEVRCSLCSPYTCLLHKVSLSDSDLSPFKGYYDNGFRQHRPLKLKKKFYEFYTAPITKFWADSVSFSPIFHLHQLQQSYPLLQMAYVLFLVLFSFTVLVKMQPTPSWQELYSIAYITTLGCEKIREIVSSEPVAIS
jgi:transient receptor potential cation channel subfamily M member 3